MVHTFTQGAFTCPLELTRCVATTRAGTRCRRRSFRHPLCMQHLWSVGLDLRPSPIHGCGLFATRPFRKGDVLLPYTGTRHLSQSVMLPGSPARNRASGPIPALQNRTESPYAFQVAGGQVSGVLCGGRRAPRTR